MSQMNYRFRAAQSQVALEDQLLDGGKYENMEALKSYCQALLGGNQAAIVETSAGAEAADGTLTIASSGAQSVTISGTTLTGGTAYAISGLSAAQIALNLAAAINASSDPQVQLVEASASAAVVTVVSKANGVIGNLIATTATGAASAQQATLAGGVSGTPVVMKFNLAI